MAKIDRLIVRAKEHLEPEEEVQAVLMGQYEVKRLGADSIRTGIFVATDRRIVFYAKKLTGYDMESFPYSNISSIEMSKGLMGHSISFFASGNKVRIKWTQNKDNVQKFVAYVRQHIGKKAAPAPAIQLDVADQIKKLAELEGAGILSKEEFQEKKKELLTKL